MTRRPVRAGASGARRPVLRPAVAAEVSALSALALRSKAHWGYDDDFIDACRSELTVRPDDLGRDRVTVAVDAATHQLMGFSSLSGVTDDEAELSALFVEPVLIGSGVGRILFDDVMRVAATTAVRRVWIEADPFAAAFYEHVGAARVGSVASSSIPGRELPLYVVDLPVVGTD